LKLFEEVCICYFVVLFVCLYWCRYFNEKLKCSYSKRKGTPYRHNQTTNWFRSTENKCHRTLWQRNSSSISQRKWNW
jgi:hypothetical protein